MNVYSNLPTPIFFRRVSCLDIVFFTQRAESGVPNAESQSDSPVENPPQTEATKRNPFFPMVLFSATVFVLTILAMVAVIFSDPNAPVAKFFNANAGRLIAAEVVVTLVVGLLALIMDRLQTRRGSQTPSDNSKEA